MSHQADLERGYRRLLVWYPRAFRHGHGPELLAVLMACAPAGRRRPGLAVSADLIRNGLRMRLHPRVPRSARTVRAAVGLMYAGAALAGLNLLNGVYLTIALASVDNNQLRHVRLPELAGSLQVAPLKPVFVAEGIAGDLVVIALWRWMARSAAQRRSWARIAATTLFGLATLEAGLSLAGPRLILASGFPGAGLLALVTWPVGAAAAALLWRATSTTFLRRPDLALLPGGDS